MEMIRNDRDVIWLNLFSFFICGCQHHERKTICLYVYISDIRQIVGYRTPVFIQPFPWRLMQKVWRPHFFAMIYQIKTRGSVGWACVAHLSFYFEEILYRTLHKWFLPKIRLFRIMSIPTTFRLFCVLTSEMLGRRLH
jgi:hypothetical protein